MTQPMLMGLTAALASLAVAVLGLIGVLVTTQVNFKLGRRTGDIAQATADSSRAAQLAEENRKLREEIAGMWTAEQDLRRQMAESAALIVRLNAEASVALRAQERAEGGLAVARQALKDVCPSGGAQTSERQTSEEKQ